MACSVLSFSAVVKSDTHRTKIALRRERHNYTLPEISSSRYIRALYDVSGSDPIDVQKLDGSAEEEPPCLIFEWMEHDLRSVHSDQYRQNSDLPKNIAKSVLSALHVIGSQYKATHTGRPSLVVYQIAQLTQKTSTLTTYSFLVLMGLLL